MPHHVLVAYDESTQAEAALEHALTNFPDAKITILHVTDPREWVYVDDVGGGYYSDQAFEQAQTSADDLLSAAAERANAAGTTVQTASEMGRPASVVVEYAEEHDMDHIVMGSHGRTGLSRFLLGSVAEAVAKRSPVSVTIIRESSNDSDS